MLVVTVLLRFLSKKTFLFVFFYVTELNCFVLYLYLFIEKLKFIQLFIHYIFRIEKNGIKNYFKWNFVFYGIIEIKVD